MAVPEQNVSGTAYSTSGVLLCDDHGDLLGLEIARIEMG